MKLRDKYDALLLELHFEKKQLKEVLRDYGKELGSLMQRIIERQRSKIDQMEQQVRVWCTELLDREYHSQRVPSPNKIYKPLSISTI